MKKFFLKIIVFFLILGVIDLSIGFIFSSLLKHAKSGDSQRINYIVNETHEDILIMGSSRAMHHYNSQIIKDSLGLSCYNCGIDGNGIILNYGLIKLIEQRYTPKIVILDFTSGHDMLKSDNHRYLSWLKMYYNRSGIIPSIFDTIDKKEKWKMISSMYRFNSFFIQILSDYFFQLKKISKDGYEPYSGAFLKPHNNFPPSFDPDNIDTVKISFLKNFLSNISDTTQIYVVISPVWYGMDNNELKFIKDLCNKYKVFILDFSNNSEYVHNDSLFVDGVHLNEVGARKFSFDLVKTIKQLNEYNFDK